MIRRTRYALAILCGVTVGLALWSIRSCSPAVAYFVAAFSPSGSKYREPPWAESLRLRLADTNRRFGYASSRQR